MTSPSLPSPSSLQPLQRPRGFVTASALLQGVDLLQDVAVLQDVDLPPPVPKDELPPEAFTKTGRLRKAWKKPQDDSDSAPKPPSRKKPAAKAREAQPSTDQAPATAPKRPRKKKTTDTDDADKPAPKRQRKKTADADETDKAAPQRQRKKTTQSDKPKPPPEPRKSIETKTRALPDPLIGNNKDNATAEPVGISHSTAPVHLDPAPKRRRDWTPPPQSDLPPSFQHCDDSSPAPDNSDTIPLDTGIPQLHDGHDDTSTTPLQFTDLMSDFGYQQQDARQPVPSLSRTTSDQPTSKSKLLDPVQVSPAKDPPKRRKQSEPKPKPPKKPRAPKKKPTTITALATAAYRAQDPDDTSGQSKLISNFFAHPEQAGDVTTTTAKPTKRQNADDKAAPKRKRSKKVQITVPEIPIKLHSPVAALESMKTQQWLFGSSSQLAAAESPTELRHLQQALKESEEMVSSQYVESLRATSYTRVPSAPHGTSLSIGQASRILWMSAARDFDDSTFASDVAPDVSLEETAENPLPIAADDGIAFAQSVAEEPSAHQAGLSSEFIEISSSDRHAKGDESPDSGYIDIDDLDNEAPKLVSADEKPLPRRDHPEMVESRQAACELIASDVSPDTNHVPRSALGALDPNTSLSKQVAGSASKESGTSHLDTMHIKDGLKASANAADSPEKLPQSRLGKVREDREPTPPRKPVGRPRIHPVSPPSTRGRGRPPVQGCSPDPAGSKGRPEKYSLSPLRSARNQQDVIPSSDYLDIDDIEDPEGVTIATSPPRCQPTATPKPTLELSNPSAIAPAAVSLAAPRTSKQLQADWASIMTSIFPRITSTIRSTPPSKDSKTPTWHEKMLLYDPIVLEDLTAWLNAQGLRIETTRPKAAEKGKKKKKKTAAKSKVEVVEMETVQDELQAWMVQKWCEEHSVCCLWKEGLRGGVRQKY